MSAPENSGPGQRQPDRAVPPQPSTTPPSPPSPSEEQKDSRIYKAETGAFGTSWSPSLTEYEIEARKMLALEDLVAEQRTANLIALGMYALELNRPVKVFEQVLERLDVEAWEDKS